MEGFNKEVVVSMSRELVFGSLLLALVVVVSAMGVAEAADFTIKPRIFTSASYNDNVEEVDGGKGDYVGTIKPGVTMNYESGRVLLDLSYDLQYKHYLDGVRSNEWNNYLEALGKVEAIKDLFFVEVSDTYKKVYTDATRGDVPEGETNVTTTDQNIFGLKPYFVFPIQERTDLTVGGEFQDIWYSEEENVDKRNYSAFVDVAHEMSENWEVSIGAKYLRQDPRWEEGGFERYSLPLGTKYSYAEGSFIEGRLEPTRTDYQIVSDSDKEYLPYYAGITHAFTENLEGKLSSSLEFVEDPQSADTQTKFQHQAGLTQSYDRGSYGFSLAYNDYETRDSTSRTTYWRPTLYGNHSMTERLSLNYSTYCDFHTNPKHDKFWFTTMSLNYGISDNSTLGLSYRFKLNDEDSKGNDYTSNTVGLTYSWSY